MGISCSCSDDYDWFYEVDNSERIALTDFKCYGCCKAYPALTETRNIHEYEMDEDGDEINYKSMGRICPSCAGIYDSLIELGFCLSADRGFITEALNDYHDNYGNQNSK